MHTEERNPRTRDLDLLDTHKILQLINTEDLEVAPAVSKILTPLADTVDRIVQRLKGGGRLIYVGAGTSGRLGLLDAVECPPTFGVSSNLVVGVLAGGLGAGSMAAEGVEDSVEAAEEDLERLHLATADALVGIAASGRTPYTCAALAYGRKIGALTVAVSNNPGSPLGRLADIALEVDTGPEPVAGSTRMKAGTAQKLILNMISTASMIRLGHVFDNLMVNVQLTNQKLTERGVGIVQEVTGVSSSAARAAVEESGDVRTAIVMLARGCGAQEARLLLAQHPSLRSLLESPSGQVNTMATKEFVTFKEITSQARVLATVLGRLAVEPPIMPMPGEDVLLTGCGSSLFLASLIREAWGARFSCHVSAVPASELVLRPDSLLSPSAPRLVLGISRTGETSETNLALKAARSLGSRVAGITCDPGSRMAADFDSVLVFPELLERSHVMTRAFTGIAGALLAWAGFLDQVERLPGVIEESLTIHKDQLRRLASKKFDQVLFLGSGPLHSLACESALKLKEMAGVPAEPVQTFEFRHGHQATITPGTLVWHYAGGWETAWNLDLITYAGRFEAEVVTVGWNLLNRLGSEVAFSIDLPSEAFAPEVEAVGLAHLIQLYAYYCAIARGRNPDAPERLNRCVLLEREDEPGAAR